MSSRLSLVLLACALGLAPQPAQEVLSWGDQGDGAVAPGGR